MRQKGAGDRAWSPDPAERAAYGRGPPFAGGASADSVAARPT